MQVYIECVLYERKKERNVQKLIESKINLVL